MSIKILARYDVVKELGKGPYGVVYQATDTRMMRPVLAKKIAPVSMSQTEELLRNARDASVLHHPNILPLNDLGSSDGAVYLVQTWVQGESLQQYLKRNDGIRTNDSVKLVIDVLDALASAHGQDVLHLDIKPANILVSASGQHFLMDFGMAQVMRHPQTPPKKELAVYMAPEVIEGEPGQARSDIYSVGMVLYEMLNQSGSGEGNLDPRLEKIVLKSTEKRPGDRYASAVDMRQALVDYLEALKEVKAGSHEADVASTLKFLLWRIKSKSDFPAISGVINQINRTVASDTDDSAKLAQIILQDFSLTNKLLKLVNSTSYSQFGGKISTVSKAVSILGFETVRNIASTLVLMDFLSNKAQSQGMKDAVVSSFFSGIMAIKLSGWKSAQEVEEAMVCSLFFNLGRMLTKFYFYDESEEIANLVEKRNISEDQAALEILGISYNELGLGIARTWNFPETLIAGMHKIAANRVLSEADNYGRLNVAVNMANDICMASQVSDPGAREMAMQSIQTRYAAVADASNEKIATVLSNSLQDLNQRASALGVETSRSPVMDSAKKLLVSTVEKVKAERGDAAENKALDDLVKAGGSVETSEDKVNTEAFLSGGLQDVINTMSGTYKLNDVLQMVLETMYRGLGFARVMVLSRDAKRNMMVARFGFGDQIVNILPDFHFSMKHENDVFHLALEKGVDIVIEDVGAPNIANKIPAWHAKAVTSRYFMLLPMMMGPNPIGMIYADMEEAKKLKISAGEMAILRNLRNQAVEAIRQQSKG